MKRRKFVLGLGAVTASGATIVGSGAFTSVEADRTISVDTAQDSDAFLELDSVGTGGRSTEEGNLITFEFPTFEEKRNSDLNSQNPSGLGADSVYRFADDIEESDRNGLLRITNSGTQPVDVFAEQETSGDVPEVDIFNIDTGDLLTPENPFEDLEVGEDPLHVGFQIDTFGVDVDSYDIVLTIVADADHETDG